MIKSKYFHLVAQGQVLPFAFQEAKAKTCLREIVCITGSRYENV